MRIEGGEEVKEVFLAALGMTVVFDWRVVGKSGCGSRWGIQEKAGKTSCVRTNPSFVRAS